MVGDRVGVGYQQAACFSCELCRSGNEQLCPGQKVIGVDCYGGAAEYIGVDRRFVFKLSPALAIEMVRNRTVSTSVVLQR
jgi:D-arabinose 1-dehydrogenase-like Zn-dependent alcohol dehydrogenase